MATTTPPATCPGCGAGQVENSMYLLQFGEQFYTCKAVWTTRSGFVHFCVNAFAWAAQHRPLLGELVAALERLLRATEILTLDDNYAQEYDSEVKEWQAADVAARAALAKVAAQD